MSSLLRTRLIQDLRIRNYSQKTIEIYVRCIAAFAKYFGQSPDQLGEGHVREYQRYLVEERKSSWALFNQTVCALRFLYGKTLHKDWAVEHIPFPKTEKRLPEVLSVEEVSRLFASVRTLKTRTILQTMYAAGLRLMEALKLKPSDIDSHRMVLRIQQGKGRQDRYVTLSPNSARDTSRILPGLSAGRTVAVSESRPRVSNASDGSPASLSDGRPESRPAQTSDDPHSPPQFCDKSSRGGSRPTNHSDSSGAR